jgi:hypothetical protein
MYLLKSVLLTVLLGVTTFQGVAKSIYVSAAGSDANDGLSATTALQTVAKAVEVAAIGDVIIINGEVPATATAEIAKDLTLIGENGATVKGDGNTRLFTAVEGAVVTFQGIKFLDGSAEGSAGAVLIQSDAHVEFYSCEFVNNRLVGDGDGGALTIEGLNTYVKIYNCIFNSNSSERRGGAIGVRGEEGDRPVVEIAYSTFNRNTTPEGSGENRGGVFSIYRGEISLYMCDIKNNAAGKRADSANPQGEGAGGGAVVISNDATFYCENTSFTGNSGSSHGAVFFAMGASNHTFVNTSFVNNLGDGDGVGLFWMDGEPMTTKFVNVTFAKNTRPGGNDWNFAGVRILKNTFTLDVFNSIFVWNAALNGDGTSNGSGDIGFNGDHNSAAKMAQFTVKNSVIGHIDYNGALENAFTLADNPALPASVIGEYDNRGNMILFEEDQSGLDLTNGYLTSATNRQGLGYSALNAIGYYTLTSGSLGTQLGDPAVLSEFGSIEDQFATERSISGGAIFAGAVQLTDGTEAPAPQTPNPYPVTITGITTPSAQVKDINVSTLVSSNGILSVDFGSLSGKAKGELININGQVAKVLFNKPVLKKDFFAMDGVAPGFYILKVDLGGNTYAKRIIVK